MARPRPEAGVGAPSPQYGNHHMDGADMSGDSNEFQLVKMACGSWQTHQVVEHSMQVPGQGPFQRGPGTAGS